jgi:hypothetical protein
MSSTQRDISLRISLDGKSVSAGFAKVSEDGRKSLSELQKEYEKSNRVFNNLFRSVAPEAYAASVSVEKFGTGLRDINRAMEGGRSVKDATAALAGLQSRYGLVADAAGLMAAGMTKVGTLAASMSQQLAIEAEATNRLATAQQRAAVAAEAQASINARLGVRGGSDTVQRAADIAAYGVELERLRAKYVPLVAIQQQYRKDLLDLAAAERTGALSAAEAAVARDKIKAAFAGQVNAVNNKNLQNTDKSQKSGLEPYQLTNLSYQLNDVFVQLASGQNVLMILAQQGPQITQAVGGFGVAFRALVSPVGLAALALTSAGTAAAMMAASYENSQRAVNGIASAFRATGRDADLSNGQIRGLIEQVAHLPTVSRAGAQEIVASFAKIRAIAPSSIGDLSKASAQLALLMGTDVPTAAKTMGESFANPTAGAKQFDEKLGGLTVTQLRQIESLQRQGNLLGAQKALYEALLPTLSKTQNTMTPLQKAVDDLAHSWDNLIHAFSDQQWVAALTQALANAVNGFRKFTMPTPEEETQHLKEYLSQYQGVGGSIRRVIAAPSDFFSWGLAPLMPFSTAATTSNDIKRAQIRLDGLQKVGPRKILPSTEVGPVVEGGNGFIQGTFSGLTASQVSDLIGQYDTLAEKKRKLKEEGVALSTQVGREGVDQEALQRAIEKNNAEYRAAKDSVQLAQEAWRREAAVLAQPITQREIYRAKVEAVSAALQAGETPHNAYLLGLQAEAQAQAKLQDQYRQRLADIDAEIVQTQALTAARSKGGLAVVDAQTRGQAEDFAKNNPTVDVATLQAKLKGAAAAHQADSAEERLQSLQDGVALAQRQLDLAGALPNVRDAELARLRTMQEIEQSMPLATEAQKQRLVELAEEQSRLNSEAQKMQGIYDDIANAGTEAFDKMLQGGQDAFSALSESIIGSFRHAFAEAMSDELVRPLAKNLIGGASSLFGDFSFSSLFSFANGGIMTSAGAVPLRTYSKGGVANSPQLALYGEGQSPEAFVPLPDGRRIPVAMEGGGGDSVTQKTTVTIAPQITISVSGGIGDHTQATEMAKQVQKGLVPELKRLVAEELRLQQRPGGAIYGRGWA